MVRSKRLSKGGVNGERDLEGVWRSSHSPSRYIYTDLGSKCAADEEGGEGRSMNVLGICDSQMSPFHPPSQQKHTHNP